jgi:hypothetical protein
MERSLWEGRATLVMGEFFYKARVVGLSKTLYNIYPHTIGEVIRFT